VEIGEGGEATARGTVTLVEYLGSEIFLYVRLPSGQMILVEAAGKASHKIGENLPLLIASDNVHVFDAKGQRVSAVREGVLS
jgi:ABC-type sugar transport system ATPase subunit